MDEYSMEELLPVMAKLAGQYTGFEHTSITYEKAEQLMEAVLYCIREDEAVEDCSLIRREKRSAMQAYEAGYQRVVKKVKAALNLYNEISQDFVCYENICLRDTFLTALPEFFRWYDARFAPMNTILTLDYPVLKDLSAFCGVNKIYAFLLCIRQEQNFLHKIPVDDVQQILNRYHPHDPEMIENICEIVLQAVVEYWLAGKSWPEKEMNEEDVRRIRRNLWQSGKTGVRERIRAAVRSLVAIQYGGDCEMLEYLGYAADNIAVRMGILYPPY